ncbi:MAG: methyltransferase domain-containing protein [Bacteroidetes bacterium]|nr:methyltransferase domain-containing protein [Bacteroidota bacterium]
MPRWILASRRTDLVEEMDDPSCDPVRLDRTYAWFARLNPWLTRWNAVYRRHVRPLLRQAPQARILDLGCGGGDVARLLLAKARRDGFAPSVLGADPDLRALAHAQRLPDPDLTFRACLSSDLVAEGDRFDLVISNHVLHHLDDDTLLRFLSDSAVLSRNLVLHNDIRRDDLAWLAFWPVALPAHFDSFILVDGLRSIRRAWHPSELAPRLGAGWRIETAEPFRMLLIHEGHD